MATPDGFTALRNRLEALFSSREKSYREDSHQSIHPSETVALAHKRLLAARLIKEAAVEDITHLTDTGIPAYRPATYRVGNEWGKGVSRDQSQASALMELVERYSSTKPAPAKLLHEFSPRLDKPHIGFRDLSLTNFQRFLWQGNDPPETTRMYWSEMSDLSSGEKLYAPASRVWLAFKRQTFVDFNCSNGLAAGNTLLEAAVQAGAELIERHVYHCFYGGDEHATKRIDLGSAGNSHLRQAVSSLEQAGYVVVANHHRSSLPFSTVSTLTFNPASEIEFGGKGAYVHFGTAPDPQIALIRCLTEAVQSMAVLRFKGHYSTLGRTERLPAIVERELRWRLDDEPVCMDELPTSHHTDFLDDLTDMVFGLQEKGLRVLFADLTHSVLQIPVVRLLIPSLQNNFMLMGHAPGSFKAAITPHMKDHERIWADAYAGVFAEQRLFENPLK